MTNPGNLFVRGTEKVTYNGEPRTFKVVVKGFDSGLNELLSGVYYDPKYRRVFNPIKAKNDKICIENIRFKNPALKGVEFTRPIIIHYFFYMKNKHHDRSNTASAFMKSFEDALQKVGILKNDSWDYVYGFTTDFAIDKANPRVEIVIEEVDKEQIFWKGWSNG